MRLLAIAVVLLTFCCVDARDKYEVLGIYGSATKGTIRTKYRELSKKYHPDTLRGKSAEEQAKAKEEFDEITAAFRVLIDPVKRKRYDQYGDERGPDENQATLARQKLKIQEDDFEGGFASYLPIVWLVACIGVAFSGLVKDDPNKKKYSKKGKKGKKSSFVDEIFGIGDTFMNSSNQTKLIVIGIVGCLLLSFFTMDADELTGPKEKTEDQKEFDYNVKYAYEDLNNGKPHRALKAFNKATDLDYGKTQPAPYIEMSKILIDLNEASNAEPMLSHAFSLLPKVDAVSNRKGTEEYMTQAFIANYDVSDEGAAMSDEDEFKELKQKFHADAGLILEAAIKYYSKKRTRNEPLVEKLTDFKKGIFEGIEDNSGDAVNSDEFDEEDKDDHFDSKPDFDKMVDEEDEDE